MTPDLSLERNKFELRGHDCPLGAYPSLAVPVGTLNLNVVAVYSSEAGPRFEPVRPYLRFSRHNQATAGTLLGFDPFRHGLFALSEADLVLFNLGEEKAFYSRLLRYSPAFYIEPFYRLSLAIETGDLSLIRPIYFSCARHMARDAQDFTEVWMKAIELASPIVQPLRDEWRDTLNNVTTTRSHIATSEAAALVDAERDQPRRFPVTIGAQVTSAVVYRAFSSMVLADAAFKVEPGGAYSRAISASLGFLESQRPTLSRPPDRELEYLPNAKEVARVSGLSLPHLELLNIILSKETAVRFLELSESRIAPRVLRSEVLTPAAYTRHFRRVEVKIVRRLVFTYAELLSMLGYTGSIDLPAELFGPH